MLSEEFGSPFSSLPALGIITGIHLCGELSIRAVQLFHSLPKCRALVLCPCCPPLEFLSHLSSKNKAIEDARDAPISSAAKEKRDSKEFYDLWCLELALLARPGSKFAFERDTNVEPLRNNYLTFTRRQTIQEMGNGGEEAPGLERLLRTQFLDFLLDRPGLVPGTRI